MLGEVQNADITGQLQSGQDALKCRSYALALPSLNIPKGHEPYQTASHPSRGPSRPFNQGKLLRTAAVSDLSGLATGTMRRQSWKMVAMALRLPSLGASTSLYPS